MDNDLEHHQGTLYDMWFNRPVYVIAQGPAPVQKGIVVACGANGKSSMTPVHLDEDTPETLKGYAGHDEYEAMEGTFARRFPIFEGDKETGKTRQVQYKLVKGEASWQLKVDKPLESRAAEVRE